MTGSASGVFPAEHAAADLFPRNALIWAGLAYLVFVIYGSLVPLHFHPLPWVQAWSRFQAIPYLRLEIGSRADWVANILLFIPLAFLWSGALWPRRNRALQFLASLLIAAGGVALSVGVEFAQVYFPPRTVSLNDILAETIGAFLGLTAWWASGPSVARWYVGWRGSHALDLAQRLLYLYLFVLFGYNLLPLDLTLSPVEIYHKWREGRVILQPFGFVFANPVEALYGLASDVLIWAPVGFLWRLSGKKNSLSIWGNVVAAAAVLELLQLFVYTRVSDATDILSAAAGGAMGLWLGSPRAVQGVFREPGPIAGRGRSQAVFWSAAALLWLTVIAAVFWYPFDFRFEREFIRERLPELNRLPFETYYFSTEYRAATEVLHKVGFFLPLGALLGLAQVQIRPYPWRRIFGFVAMGFIALAALSIELGKVLLPGKYPDITNISLELLGGVLGLALLSARTAIPFFARFEFSNARKPPTRMFPLPPPLLSSFRKRRSAAPTENPPAYAILVGVVLLVSLSWLAMHSGLMPYNVRELLMEERPVSSLLLLSCFLYWSMELPVWAARWLSSASSARWAYPGLVLLHSAVAWALLRAGVPMESIHDIVGSPVLGWLWEWEIMGRFIALFSVVSLQFTAAALAAAWIAERGKTPVWTGKAPAWIYWLATALLLLPIAHWVIVTEAATDNLTELMARGGDWLSSVLLALFVLGLAAAASLLARAASAKTRLRAIALVWLTLWLPLSYLTLSYGTEGTIVKYGKVFSALQFLLSTDREHYAAGAELLVRYAIFYLASIGIVALIQFPYLNRRSSNDERSIA